MMLYDVTYPLVVLIEKLAFFNKQLEGFIISLTDTKDIEEPTEASENTIPDISFTNQSIYQNYNEMSTTICTSNHIFKREIFPKFH